MQTERDGLTTQLARVIAAKEAAERARVASQAESEKMSSSMSQWKLDLHKQLVARYDKLFSGVSARARADRENFARKLLEEEERRFARELAGSGSAPASPGGDGEQALAPDAIEMFLRRREKLVQLWQTLDTDPAERGAIADSLLAHLVGLGPGGVNSPQRTVSPRRNNGLASRVSGVVAVLSEELRREIQRLEAQLPLMEVITRREFLKHRINDARGLAASQGVVAVPEEEELLRELQRLDTQLARDLPLYERTYRAKLFYKNQRYLHLLEQQMSGAHAP